MMNRQDDLSHIGRRMPYSTPKGCFEKMQDDLWKRLTDAHFHPDQHSSAEANRLRSLHPHNLLIPTAAGRGCGVPGESSGAKGRQPWYRRKVAKGLMAMAASVVVAMLIGLGMDQPTRVTANDVDRAFLSLTQADQDFLINVYQCDVFIDE